MIVLVAVRAFRKCNVFLEVSLDVASHTLHRRVLAQQRIFRLVVIEIVAQAGARDFLPRARVVTAGAGFAREAPFVRVSVTIIALTEGKTAITRRTIRARRVTLLAFHLLMQAGQRIARLRVVELA